MSGATAAETIQGFLTALRDAGLRIGLARAEMLHQGLALLPLPGLSAVYLAGRTTLCGTPQEVMRYDACFARYFFSHDVPLEILPDPKAPPVLPGIGELKRQAKPKRDDQDDDRELEMGAASAREVLRRRKLSAMSADERDLIHELIAGLRGKVALQMGRRRRPAARGLVDVRRTVKAAQLRGGEPERLLRTMATRRARKRVLLLDVSGSMAPFAPGLLRFGYAAFRCAPRRTEVFTIGTRLTRISRAFGTQDAEAAIAAASSTVQDWSGGTRLGDQIKAFLDIWGQRGLARGAIVVIASDGWERGATELLQAQMARLRGLAHRVIWANPHKSTPGFEPLTRGMQAALPSIDDFVAGSSAAEFETLIRLMGNASPRRRL